LELALGCHFRVAVPGAQIRASRGQVRASSGRWRNATSAARHRCGDGVEHDRLRSDGVVPAVQGTALIDEIIDGDVLQGALAFAQRVVNDKRPLTRVRDAAIDYPNAEAFFQFARNSVAPVAKNFPAPLKCIDAVAAAVSMPFDEGVRFERELFNQLLATPESRALRHAFFAERAAAKIADVPDNTPPRKIARVAVIGAGTMGGGIAMSFINADIPSLFVEAAQDALDRGVGKIRETYESSLKKGRITPNGLQQNAALLTPTLTYDDIVDADLVIEAVFEDMAIKERVFRRLDELARPGCDSGDQHIDAGRQCNRRLHPSPAGCGGHAFFQPGPRDETARGRARRKDRTRRTAHDHEARQDDQQDGGRLRRVRWLHRQSNARALPAAGRIFCWRRVPHRSRSTQRWSSSAWRWGHFG
jgi:3-hydroxyacyl-CoA dehydrogenase